MRPIRSSIEGLNQEIEKLVLHPGTGRANRLDQVSALRCTPERGHESPQGDGAGASSSRTPVSDLETGFFTHHHHHHYHSDESHDSLSPSDEPPTLGEAAPGQPRSFLRIGSAEASPRLNKFMAQLPPEGCERVLSRTVVQGREEASATLANIVIIKPVAGFQLRPSQGSAFCVANSLLVGTADDSPEEEKAAAVGDEKVEVEGVE